MSKIPWNMKILDFKNQIALTGGRMISSVESSWAEFPLEPFSCEDGAEDGSSRPNRLTEVSGVDPGDANPPPSEVAVEDGEEVIGFAFWIRKARKLLIFSQNWQIYLVNKQCSFSEEALTVALMCCKTGGTQFSFALLIFVNYYKREYNDLFIFLFEI